MQYLRNLEVDMADANGSEDDLSLERVTELEADKNDGISCELGIRYPTLQSIMSGRKNHLSIQVNIAWYISYDI
jgi:hypothetical protein